jgi:group I intron endonuclease
MVQTGHHTPKIKRDFKMKQVSNKSGIYKLTANNGEFYIGGTKNLYSRRSNHFYTLERGIHHNPLLQKYANDHGINSFSFEVIEYCAEDELVIREQHYLDTLKPAFNIAKEAKHPNAWEGRHHTEEAKRRLSIATSSRPGFAHTDESKAKISNGNKGKVRTAEYKQNLSDARKGVKRGPFTEEHKRKISEARKGFKWSIESRMKLSETRKQMFLAK